MVVVEAAQHCEGIGPAETAPSLRLLAGTPQEGEAAQSAHAQVHGRAEAVRCCVVPGVGVPAVVCLPAPAAAPADAEAVELGVAVEEELPLGSDAWALPFSAEVDEAAGAVRGESPEEEEEEEELWVVPVLEPKGVRALGASTELKESMEEEPGSWKVLLLSKKTLKISTVISGDSPPLNILKLTHLLGQQLVAVASARASERDSAQAVLVAESALRRPRGRRRGALGGEATLLLRKNAQISTLDRGNSPFSSNMT